MVSVVALRRAALAPLAFPGVRRASEIAALRLSDVVIDESAGLVGLKGRCQKNDQLEVDRMAQVVAVPTWKGGCPVRLSYRLCSRARMSRFRGRENRMPVPPKIAPVSAGLARARFGLGMAPSGMTAAWKKGSDGRNLSSIKGGVLVCSERNGA